MYHNTQRMKSHAFLLTALWCEWTFRLAIRTLQMILDGSKEIQAVYMVLMVGYSINSFQKSLSNVGCIALASNLVLALFEYSGIQLPGRENSSFHTVSMD